MTTSLVVTLFSEQISAGLFGHGDISDATLGAAIGSIAVGHPLASYLLGGAVKRRCWADCRYCYIGNWVTVGIVTLSAEALMLGARFAVYRNIAGLGIAIIIALLTVYTIKLLELA